MAPWSEFGREVGADDCFGEPPLDFAGRRSTEGDEGTFVQKILDLEDCVNLMRGMTSSCQN